MLIVAAVIYWKRVDGDDINHYIALILVYGVKMI